MFGGYYYKSLGGTRTYAKVFIELNDGEFDKLRAAREKYKATGEYKQYIPKGKARVYTPRGELTTSEIGGSDPKCEVEEMTPRQVLKAGWKRAARKTVPKAWKAYFNQYETN